MLKVEYQSDHHALSRVPKTVKEVENNIYELKNSKAEKETNLVKRNNLITLLSYP